MRTSVTLRTGAAFSLVEVVLALGIISFAIVAILGVMPVGLGTGRAAQDDTRAVQLAQTLLDGMASQAQAKFSAIAVPVSSGSPAPLDLSQSTSNPATPAVALYASNDGQLSDSPTAAAYSVKIITNNAPPGFESGSANAVTINVAWPVGAPAAKQTLRSYSRVITKY